MTAARKISSNAAKEGQELSQASLPTGHVTRMWSNGWETFHLMRMLANLNSKPSSSDTNGLERTQTRVCKLINSLHTCHPIESNTVHRQERSSWIKSVREHTHTHKHTFCLRAFPSVSTVLACHSALPCVGGGSSFFPASALQYSTPRFGFSSSTRALSHAACYKLGHQPQTGGRTIKRNRWRALASVSEH